jgi:hypothetical protein
MFDVPINQYNLFYFPELTMMASEGWLPWCLLHEGNWHVWSLCFWAAFDLTKLVFTHVNGENDKYAKPVVYRYGSLPCESESTSRPYPRLVRASTRYFPFCVQVSQIVYSSDFITLEFCRLKHPLKQVIRSENQSINSRDKWCTWGKWQINAKFRCKNKTVWRPRRRREHNTAMDLGETECG